MEAGLVAVRREGRFRYYRVDPDGLAGLRQAVEMFWSNELDELVRAPAPMREESNVPFEKAVLVPLGPDETFALLTDPARLRRWQAVAARIDLRAGGEYRFTINPGHSAAGTVQEVEPGRRLRFTWGWEGDEALPPGASTVTITLEPAEGGTEVRLVHEGLTPEQAAGHAAGWDHYFGRLVAAARDGDAGPDPWGALPDPLDELSAAEAALASCERVLRDLAPDGGAAPTPCPEFTVDGLVDHLIGSLEALGAAAGASAVPASEGPHEQRVAAVAAAVLEAWRRRGTAGEVVLRGGAVPAGLPVTILPVELLVHAWDFARASGQGLLIDERVAGYVLDLARALIVPELRSGNAFAAEIASGPDANNLERLVAFTGRQL
jgi:uncharacterized protein (TIGR03086 family)